VVVRHALWVLALGLGAGACGEAAIVWGDASTLPQPMGAAERIAFGADGALQVVAAPSATVPPWGADGRPCRESVRFARDTTGEWYAVWWDARPDSTAEILVARSADGARWDPPMRVDTVDAGRSGCRRPAPAIDAWGGHVHVAYAMAAREGPGIFASHSMDRGALFHTPVAVVYGERIGAADIAARGNLVAIAFEDPNAAQDHIGIAYSSTMAHLFQHRETVSSSGGAARSPRVTIADRRIGVAWTRASGGAAAATVARVGAIR
jgi:hypothetical protein